MDRKRLVVVVVSGVHSEDAFHTCAVVLHSLSSIGADKEKLEVSRCAGTANAYTL